MPRAPAGLSPGRGRDGGNVESASRANCELFGGDGSCRGTLLRLDCRLHRARGASRSKPSREVVRASGRSVGWGDESATGSVNFFALVLVALTAAGGGWQSGPPLPAPRTEVA